MTKTLMLTLIVFIFLQVGLKVVSETCPYGRCAGHIELIADKICAYRHEKGEWPKDVEEIRRLQLLEEEKEMETLFGVPLDYDPAQCTLSAQCPHEGVPFLSWIKFTGYFSGCSSHGLSLTNRFEKLYGN
jgi:hypothetical protein